MSIASRIGKLERKREAIKSNVILLENKYLLQIKTRNKAETFSLSLALKDLCQYLRGCRGAVKGPAGAATKSPVNDNDDQIEMMMFDDGFDCYIHNVV